ncbi:MAG: sugar phosphate isomerase/epimerase family protein [Desulforhopalus sp.]
MNLSSRAYFFNYFSKSYAMIYGAMNFPVLPVLQEINLFAELGFSYLELAMDQPEAHYSHIAANQATITKALQDYAMGIVCHLPTFVSTADLTDSIRRASCEEMKQSLNVAAGLGAEKVTVHPSMIGGMGAFVADRARTYAYEFLSEMVELSGELGVTICLENMMPRNNFGVECAELDTIFRRFPTLQFTFDTGHANLGDNGKVRFQELVKKFGDRIGHIHLSDNRGVHDDHLPLGQGNIDFRRLADDLQRLKYEGTVTFEVFDKDRQMLVNSRKYWRKLVSK